MQKKRIGKRFCLLLKTDNLFFPKNAPYMLINGPLSIKNINNTPNHLENKNKST